MNRKSIWINLAIVNLAIVALLGFILRSKIVFPLYMLDYRNFLSGHSHFAFAGWVGLVLTTLLIYNTLPTEVAGKKVYQWILLGTEVSSLGMAILFPIFGYEIISICFSSLYIVMNYIFAWVYIRDIIRIRMNRTVRLLSLSAILSLLVSAIGPLGLVYILLSKSGDASLYRDSIYTFLHFQYNGFFTLSVFALFFSGLLKKGQTISPAARKFCMWLCLSVIPGVFLSLLWHDTGFVHALALTGAVMMIISMVYFVICYRQLARTFFTMPFARTLIIFSFLSFGLKTILNAATYELHDAIYGDRPVIIGFLHLVFLGFVTFYVLAYLIDQGYFTRKGRLVKAPFIVFTFGVFANETLLGLQDLSILFKTNSDIYNWLLWGASIFLFSGAMMIMITRLRIKTATGSPAAVETMQQTS